MFLLLSWCWYKGEEGSTRRPRSADRTNLKRLRNQRGFFSPVQLVSVDFGILEWPTTGMRYQMDVRLELEWARIFLAFYPYWLYGFELELYDCGVLISRNLPC